MLQLYGVEIMWNLNPFSFLGIKAFLNNVTAMFLGFNVKIINVHCFSNIQFGLRPLCDYCHHALVTHLVICMRVNQGGGDNFDVHQAHNYTPISCVVDIRVPILLFSKCHPYQFFSATSHSIITFDGEKLFWDDWCETIMIFLTPSVLLTHPYLHIK